MYQQMQFQMVSVNSADQYNETTFTKLFVGGLAWETQRDTMKKYFEQFGEILEAVVITDKNTGRSKGYGFVTFKDPVAAMRACQNPSPVIDGRRANCNLASFGANKNRTPPSHHGAGRFRPPPAPVAPPAYHGSSSTFFHQPIEQYTLPYSAYGYSGYSQDTLYPTGYYGIYGGQHFSPYYPSGTASGAVGLVHNMYPYYSQYGFGVQYPQMPQIPILPQQHYGSIGILSFPSSISLPTTTSAVSATSATTTTISACVAATSKSSEQNSTLQG